ncbi:TIR domain-containing protein [Bradyrhizobium sp. B124]|uniref:TIR domain-containing protein n=1 Tax=Bradyrhizobium sp. B124 TaxID=3140245 RepID=UPI003183F95D
MIRRPDLALTPSPRRRSAPSERAGRFPFAYVLAGVSHRASDGYAATVYCQTGLGSLVASGIVDTDAGLRPRARQNVVFELGFVIGKFGAANVAALMKSTVEKPSDLEGIAYVP